jgi:hypothetical protein
MKRFPRKASVHPTEPHLELDNGSFELVQDRSSGKLRIMYHCRYIPATGPYAGKRCEFFARNDSHYFRPEEQGQHDHRWTITVFHEPPTLAPIPGELAPHFARFVCDTNMSLHQATQSHTTEFCNTLIRYGFSLGTSAPFKQLSATELFPDIAMPELRSEILRADRSALEQVLVSFRVGFVHLSLDAATMHGHSVLDFILLRTDPRKGDFDFVLYDSVDVTTGSLDFYASTTREVITNLDARHIHVRSIVGDGFSSQLNALSPRSPNSIQNSFDPSDECPLIKRVLYVYCSCHLANLALDKALKTSACLRDWSTCVSELATTLRTRQNSRRIGQRCPTYSPTRWCHAYLLCCFIARHFQVIIAAGFEIPDRVFTYGVLIEPLFVLISEFESRTARFYMRERKLAMFYARMRHLAQKYDQNADFVEACDLLENLVFLTFAAQEHELAVFADGLTLESKRTKLDDVVVGDQPSLFLDAFYEALLTDQAVAAVALETDPEVPADGEEEAEEEATAEAESFPEREESDDEDPILSSLHERVAVIRAKDSERGLYRIGADVIDEFADRANWPKNQRWQCKLELAKWLGTQLEDPAILADDNLPPSLHWVALGTALGLHTLKEVAEVLLSLPASEAENERTFSVRKYVVGPRGGRAKTDLVTARVRLRQESAKKPKPPAD